METFVLKTPMVRTLFSSVAAVAILLCLAPAALGQLETRATFPIFNEPILVAAGDFNHDGAQDLAVTCVQALCGGGIEVLLGKGDGTFRSASTYPVPNSPEFGLSVADLNGDGNLDILVTEYLGSAVAVLLGNGDGTFQPVLSSPAPVGGEAIRVGDFNNDGVPDAAFDIAGFPDSYISVLIGNGDGTFRRHFP